MLKGRIVRSDPARVEVACQRQRKRFAGLTNGVMTNADVSVAELRYFVEAYEVE
jgi:hypothetical protein